MPPTPKREEAAAVELPPTPEELGLSRQTQFSTYTQVELDEEQNPPDGPHVEQQLGKPSEGAAKAFGS